MKKVSEKINEERMGGFMKIRFLVIVLAAIAMVPQLAVATDPVTPGIYLPPVTFKATDPIAWDWTAALKAGLGATGTTATQDKGPSYSKCVYEEVDNFDKGIEAASTLIDGINTFEDHQLQYKLAKRGYDYLDHVADNNYMLEALNMTTQAKVQTDIATLYYRYGGGSYGNSYGTMNVNSGIKAFANDQYSEGNSEYFGSFGG